MCRSETSAMATSPRAETGATRTSQDPRPGVRTARPRPSLTATLIRVLRADRGLLSGSTAVRFVRLHDLLHERVAHDVLLVEVDERDALDLADDLQRLDEARGASGRQVDLRHVARDDRLGAEAEAREEQLHLLRRGVLRLVEDDEGVVERAAAHERDRRDFDRAALEEALDAIDLQHVVERVVERAEVRVHLFLQVARQEAELLAGLHGGTR